MSQQVSSQSRLRFFRHHVVPSGLFERYLKHLSKSFQLCVNKLPIELITVDLNTIKKEILLNPHFGKA